MLSGSWEIAKIGYNLEPARVSFLGYTALELLVVKTPAIEPPAHATGFAGIYVADGCDQGS